MSQKIAVFGASGAIGKAFVAEALSQFPLCFVHALARRAGESPHADAPERVTWIPGFDLEDELSVRQACTHLVSDGVPDLVVVASGVLHGEDFAPERRIEALESEAMSKVMAVNFAGPALILKHLVPALPRKSETKIGILSARVGSISDNQLGGWYSYRCSKAALNMLIRTASIEMARRCQGAVLVGLHPGTVASDLSAPFQQSVPKGKLFSPEQSAGYLLDVLRTRTPEQSGRCFDWAGDEIQP